MPRGITSLLLSSISMALAVYRLGPIWWALNVIAEATRVSSVLTVIAAPDSSGSWWDPVTWDNVAIEVIAPLIVVAILAVVGLAPRLWRRVQRWQRARQTQVVALDRLGILSERLIDVSPESLGVWSAGLADRVDERGLPAYVARDVDDALRTRFQEAVAAQSGSEERLIVVAGSPKAGKTRSMYEAARSVVGQWRVLVLRRPIDDRPVEVLVEVGARLDRGRRLVVWIDDAQEHLAQGGGLNTKSLGDLRRVLPEAVVAMTVHRSALDHLDSDLGDTELVRALARVSSSTVVERRLNDAELRRANDLHPGLAAQDRLVYLAEELAALPLLRERFANGEPAQRAVVEAAVAWNQIGLGVSIPTERLSQVAELLVQPYQPIPSETFNAACRWAAHPVAVASALLSPVRDDRWRAFDAFVGEHHVVVRDEVWDQMIADATAIQLRNVGEVSYYSGRLDRAEVALRQALDLGDAIAGYNLGVILGELDRSEDAVVVSDEVDQRYGSDPDPALRVQVAMALCNKGVRLGALDRSEDAVVVYDEVDQRYRSDPDPALRVPVAQTLYNKGVTLGELDRPEDEIGVYDEVDQRYRSDPDPALRVQVAQTLCNKGVTLVALDRPEDAVVVYDEVDQRYRSDPDPALRVQVAQALYNKGVTLGELDRPEDEIGVYDEVDQRYGSDPDPALRVQVAMALCNKGVRLGALDRSEDAVVVYDEVDQRYGSDPDPALRVPVAQTLYNKGVTLVALDRPEDAVVVYDEVDQRYGSDPDPALREVVALIRQTRGRDQV
ncbi:MAG: tetratricopeptide repeat protein [Acidobacteriota bacterium]